MAGLKEKFPQIPRKEWMAYTIAIAVIGWFLGMLPSLFFIPSVTGAPAEPQGADLHPPLLFALLSIGAGLFVGTLFGLFQWFSLRKYAIRACNWILANALGWGLGMGWIYLFASLPTETSPVYITAGAGAIGGILTGLSMGGITGWFLIEMQNKQEGNNNDNKKP